MNMFFPMCVEDEYSRSGDTDWRLHSVCLVLLLVLEPRTGGRCVACTGKLNINVSIVYIHKQQYLIDTLYVVWK